MEQGKAGIPSYSSYQTLLHLQLVAIEEYEWDTSTEIGYIPFTTQLDMLWFDYCCLI
jgi:hypothetical protein